MGYYLVMKDNIYYESWDLTWFKMRENDDIMVYNYGISSHVFYMKLDKLDRADRVLIWNRFIYRDKTKTIHRVIVW